MHLAGQYDECIISFTDHFSRAFSSCELSSGFMKFTELRLLYIYYLLTYLHTHTSILRPSGLCLGLPGWAGTRTNMDFIEATDSEWQWDHLSHMQICTSPQTDNHASTHHSVF